MFEIKKRQPLYEKVSIEARYPFDQLTETGDCFDVPFEPENKAATYGKISEALQYFRRGKNFKITLSSKAVPGHIRVQRTS